MNLCGSERNTLSQKKFMPDDHSDLEPLLPIPNRTVKRVCADDSADARVKVGHRQAFIVRNPQSQKAGGFVFVAPCAWGMAELGWNKSGTGK